MRSRDASGFAAVREGLHSNWEGLLRGAEACGRSEDERKPKADGGDLSRKDPGCDPFGSDAADLPGGS
ncbi:hypothetical protein JCM17042A_11660 [Ruminococcus champanellensis 18P13 = JCM 17042]